MSKEVRRKYLVSGDGWRDGDPRRIAEGYLPMAGAAQIRVRLEGEHAQLTIRSAGAGLERSEFEYTIPPDDAEALLHGFCVKPMIVKNRHSFDYEGRQWRIDEFEGANQGLIVATLDAESPDSSFPHPPWLGQEVTGDARLGSENLMRLPYRDWAPPES